MNVNNANTTRVFYASWLSATGKGEDPKRTASDFLNRYGGLQSDGAHTMLCDGARPSSSVKGVRVEMQGDRATVFLQIDDTGRRPLDRGSATLIQDPAGNSTIRIRGEAMDSWNLKCKEIRARSPSSLPADFRLAATKLSEPPRGRRVEKGKVVDTTIQPNEEGEKGNGNIPPSEKNDVKQLELVSAGSLVEIPVNKIRPNPEQPRKVFTRSRLLALGESMKQYGQQIPIKVVPVEDDPKISFELVMGERRWRAAQLVGIVSLKAVVLSREEVPGRRRQHCICMVMDFNQEGYTPLETALALLEEHRNGLSAEQLGKLCGKSIAWVYSHLALNNLTDEFRAMLLLPKRERMSFSIACRLARFPKEKQKEVWTQVSKKNGPRLQLIEIRRLGAGEGRPGAKGRPRQPSDYAANLSEHIIPRLAGDALTASQYPDTGFDCLVQHTSADKLEMLRVNLTSAAQGVFDMRRKLEEALKRKGNLQV